MTKQANTTNTKLTGEKLLKSELDRRFDLAQDEDFIAMVADVAKKLGVPADLWNNDSEFKVNFLLYWANQLCSKENEMAQ
jgi:hypothetical protein